MRPQFPHTCCAGRAKCAPAPTTPSCSISVSDGGERRPVATRMLDPRDRAIGMFAQHGELLRRVARQYSLCADDAEDAVQRALETYLRRVESLDPATELAWMKVVVKHEALAVRRA